MLKGKKKKSSTKGFAFHMTPAISVHRLPRCSHMPTQITEWKSFRLASGGSCYKMSVP